MYPLGSGPGCWLARCCQGLPWCLRVGAAAPADSRLVAARLPAVWCLHCCCSLKKFCPYPMVACVPLLFPLGRAPLGITGNAPKMNAVHLMYRFVLRELLVAPDKQGPPKKE